MSEMNVFGKDVQLNSLYSIDNLIYNLENLKEQCGKPQILLHKSNHPLSFGLFVPCRFAWQVVNWLYTELDGKGTVEKFILINSVVDTFWDDPDERDDNYCFFEDPEDEIIAHERYVTLNSELQSVIKTECDHCLTELTDLREDIEREEELNRIMHPGMQYFLGDEDAV